MSINQRVLELCTSSGFGGLELYALNTFKIFQASDVPTHMCVRRNSFLEKKLLESKLPYISLNKSSRYLPILSAIKLAHVLSKEDIDIIHMHWAKDIMLAVFAKIFSRKNIRIVYTRQMGILSDKHDWYHRFIYRHIDLLIVITEELLQQACKFLPLPAARISRLYYGVKPEEEVIKEDCTLLRKSLGIETDAFLVGLIGRIESFKGQHLLIEAIGKLKIGGHNVHGLIVGNAMDADYLTKMKSRVSELGLDNNIHFLGFHNNPQGLMSCTDCIVLTTRQETFGLVLIEAMQMGIPVIGTQSGGVPEIIEHEKTGLMFEPDNSEDLTRCMQKYIENTELKETCASNGKQKSRKNFLESKHYEKLVSMFQSVE